MANQPVKIGGTLYPSQQWYDEHVLKKGKVAPTGVEAIGQGIAGVATQIPGIQAGISALAGGEVGGVVGAGVGAGVDAGAGAGAGAEGVTTGTDFQQLILERLTELAELKKGYTPMADLYTQYGQQLGIPGQAEALKGITQEVLDVEGLLDKLDEDITARTTGGLVTGAQRRRQEATEGAPLREQMADLIRAQTRAGAGLTGARGELATMLGLEEARRTEAEEAITGDLPLYREALAKPEVEKEPTAPTSHREWELAGGEAGTGKTYAEWLEGEEKAKAPTYKYFTDSSGNVVRYNPETGVKKNLGPIGKGTDQDGGEAMQIATDFLNSKKGKDQKVAPKDWKRAKKAWTDDQLSPEDFIKQFHTFINPDHAIDYGAKEDNYMRTL